MSRKISEYFHIKPKFKESVNIEDAKIIQNHQIKEENSKEICNNNSNPPKLRECRVILKDIRTKVHKISIQENDLKNPQNIKNEQDEEYIIELPPPGAHRNSTDPMKSKQSISMPVTSDYDTSKRHKCTNCFQKFKTKENLKNHKINCKLACDICGRIFSERSNISRHKRYVHTKELQDSIFSCIICGQNFFQRPKLILHMKLKHSDGQFRKYECDFDGKLFKTKSEIYSHMYTHLPNINCKVCNAELNIGSVWGHMREVHSNRPKEICKICDKLFKTRDQLKTHLRIHNKKFECTVCGKRFSNFSSLRDHVRDIHENPGSYSCEICDKIFNKAKNLKVHLKFHDKNRPKPFKCQRCDFATHSKANYNFHLKSHERHDKKAATMKNPINCKKCPAVFEAKKKYEHHMYNSHSRNLQVQCDLCGNYYRNRTTLYSHIHSMHLKCRN